MTSEARLRELDIELPGLGTSRYTYVPFRRAGDIVFLAGQVPRLPDGSYLTGKVGSDRTVEEGREAARLCGLHMLASARAVTGSLDEVEFLKVFGMVNAAPDFRDHGLVMEGSPSFWSRSSANGGSMLARRLAWDHSRPTSG